MVYIYVLHLVYTNRSVILDIPFKNRFFRNPDFFAGEKNLVFYSQESWIPMRGRKSLIAIEYLREIRNFFLSLNVQEPTCAEANESLNMEHKNETKRSQRGGEWTSLYSRSPGYRACCPYSRRRLLPRRCWAQQTQWTRFSGLKIWLRVESKKGVTPKNI